MMKKGLGYGAAFAVFFVIELLIALYVRDAFIRPYVGDALVVILVYCFVRIFRPEGLRLLPLYVLLFAVGVEFLQYFQLVKRLGLENHMVLRTIIGSTFDVKDIGCYAVGSVLTAVYEIRKNRNRKQEGKE